MRSVSSVEDQGKATGTGLLMKKVEVAKLLGCSDRNVENLVKSGRIPRPLYLGTNSPRWRRSELLASLGLQTETAGGAR